MRSQKGDTLPQLGAEPSINEGSLVYTTMIEKCGVDAIPKLVNIMILLLCIVGCARSTPLVATDSAPSAVGLVSAAPGEASTVAMPDAPALVIQPSPKVDLKLLRRCCKRIDAIGQTLGQEGVGFVGVASVCEEMAESLEAGAPVTRSRDEWQEPTRRASMIGASHGSVAM